MAPKVRIRRFAVLKTASVFALMYVVLIAIIAIPILLILLPVALVAPGEGSGAGSGAIIGGGLLLTILVMVFYGVFAWIFGAIFCLAYNLVARWIGGIEVEVERFGGGGPDVPQGYAGAYPQQWPSAVAAQAPPYGLPPAQGSPQPWGSPPTYEPPQAWPGERPAEDQPPRR